MTDDRVGFSHAPDAVQGGAKIFGVLKGAAITVHHFFLKVSKVSREVLEKRIDNRPPEQDEWVRRWCKDRIDDDGTWSVSLPSSAFGEKGIPFSRIGSYRMAGSRFFRVWCPEETPRKHAFLDRLDQRMGSRRQVTRQDAGELITRLALQLRLEIPHLSRVRSGAERTGLSGLEAQLARLENE
ncbi:hypothetical protein [Streptomyces sp. NPDC001275]